MVQGRCWRDGGVVLNAGADRVARGGQVCSCLAVAVWFQQFGFDCLVLTVRFQLFGLSGLVSAVRF